MKKKRIKTPPSKKRALSILKGVASGFIWGFGQLLNRQFLKALFFFIFFAAFIGIELGTSKYFSKVDPYDKIVGQDFERNPDRPNQFVENIIIINYHQEHKKYTKATLPESFKAFDERFKLANGNYKLTEQDLIEFIASDLLQANPKTYRNIFNDQVIKIPGKEIDENIDKRVLLNLKEVLYRSPDQVYYKERTYKDLDGREIKDYQAVDFITGSPIADEEILTVISGFSKYEKTGQVYLVGDQAYLETLVEFGDGKMYVNISNPAEEPLFVLPKDFKKVDNIGPLYYLDEKIYEYQEPGLVYFGNQIQYRGTAFTDFIAKTMYNAYKNAIGGTTYNSEDYTRFLIKISFAMNPEIRTAFEKGFNNFFYDRAGLFLQSYWGVFTLGVTKKVDFTMHRSLDAALAVYNGEHFVRIQESVPVLGHVSTHILLQGLIGMILSLFFLIFMVWSISDAYRTSEKLYKEEEIEKGLAYFKDVYESSFEYIVLSPALFVLAMISIMPILFGFLLAFTSIAGRQSMIDTFDYVGFKNFFALFNFADGFGASFGKAFWRVLLWTIVWAIMSTATVFFGGLFQALIINSERVHFKKFWRTILILPWAMPALLSQMVFSVMFGEVGYINALFRKIGIYDLFQSLGWLGRDYSLLSGAEKFFYVGKDNIQWFTNPFNPTFVRIILIVVNIWLGFPYFMALMSGVMTSIDKTLYEAADIDGASKRQKLKYITMPLILYSTAPILIMTFSGNFNNFGVIYFITGGGPNADMYSRGFAGDTDILISWMYKLTVNEAIYNIASVFSVLIFIFVGSVTAWNLSRTRAFKGD